MLDPAIVDPASLDRDRVKVLAELLGLELDEPRTDVLRAAGSCDVQACPGSGKTSLLVAKIGLLMRGWASADRGICVVSHTNIARGEIERRLPHLGAADSALRYPHFVGTVQRFVGRFLALPYLRQRGLETGPIAEVNVDNDAFRKEALRRFAAGRFGRARAYLQRRRDWEEIVGSLQYADPELGLQLALALSPETPAHRQLSALKAELAGDGYFRFGDMYAVAARAMRKEPGWRRAVAHRFPWVLIDEAQDNEENQDAVLNTVFADSVVQRFGDSNQAIYRRSNQRATPGTFPREPTIPVTSSFRLGPATAAACARMAVTSLELGGRGAQEATRPTVLLFTVTMIDRVLPVLAAEAASIGAQCVKAVALRVRGTNEAGNLPFQLSDYWPTFDPDRRVQQPSGDRLVHFVRHGQSVAPEDWHQGFHSVVLGLGQLFGGRKGTMLRRLKDALRDCANESKDRLRHLVLHLLVCKCCEEEWPNTAELVRETAPGWFSRRETEGRRAFQDRIEEADRFLSWDEGAANVAEAGTTIATINGVAIQLSSIHGVKGETHEATLLTESFSRVHHLKSLFHELTGRSARRRTPAADARMRAAFVAMSRARCGLYLAMCSDLLPEDAVTQLEAAGFRVLTVE